MRHLKPILSLFLLLSVPGIRIAAAQGIDTRMTRQQLTSLLATTKTIQNGKLIVADSFLWAGFYGKLAIDFDKKKQLSSLISWNAQGDRKKGFPQCLPLLEQSGAVTVGKPGTPVDEAMTWTVTGNNNGSVWRLTYLKESGRISYVATLLE